MILLAISNTETIILVILGFIAVFLLGCLIVYLAKNKMEKELDLVSVESMLDNQSKPDIKVSEALIEEVEEQFDIEDMLDEDKEDIAIDSKEPISEIEAVLAKMQNDLEKEKTAAISTFEEEQEEKSIISYQELKAAKDKIVPYSDELEENQIVYKDSSKIELEDECLTKPIKKEPVARPVNKSNHFSNSEFISPVYGRLEEKKLDYPKIPSFKDEIDVIIDEPVTPDYEPLTVEYVVEPTIPQKRDIGNYHSRNVKDNQEFLKELKNFRDNLE